VLRLVSSIIVNDFDKITINNLTKLSAVKHIIYCISNDLNIFYSNMCELEQQIYINIMYSIPFLFTFFYLGLEEEMYDFVLIYIDQNPAQPMSKVKRKPPGYHMSDLNYTSQ